MGDQWSRIFEARQDACDKLGIQFLQVIVPNKLTLIPEWFPEDISVDISYPLNGILKAGTSANILAPVTEFRSDDIREAIFRRNDSHLTIAGNAYMTELIINKLGHNRINDVPCRYGDYRARRRSWRKV